MRYSIFAMVLFSNSLSSATLDKDKEKHLNAAQLHFEAGCDFEALRACGVLNGNERESCFADAEKACPKMAKNFRDFLENKKQ